MSILNILIPPVHAATIMDQINKGQPDLNIPTGATLAQILSGGGHFNIFTLVFVLSGFFFMFNIIGAGFDYVMSTGDPKKIAGATTRFINGIMGIGIVFFSFLIVNLVLSVIGLDPLI
jgi:hypothetical protein